ncbi:MAG TPA: hypothetical protein DHW02_19780 [Ktedonobacter sp.]|jgi:hypothetical protein|nr:hypothetical protein [Ktedonobacter sp.]
MNHTVVTYLAFVVAVLIITWAVVEMSRRYSRMQRLHRHSRTRNTPSSSPNQWVTLNTTSTDSDEPLSGEDAGGAQDTPSSEPQTRAKQNGHYSQSKHPH